MIFRAKIVGLASWAGLLAVLGGCAGSGSAAFSGGYRNLEISLGPATNRVLEERVYTILERYAYAIYRYEVTPSHVDIRTSWKSREPFADEMAEGSVTAETRIFIRGGPLRGTSYGLMTTRPISFIAENRVILVSDTIGVRLPNSADFIEYIQEITNILKMEFVNTQ